MRDACSAYVRVSPNGISSNARQARRWKSVPFMSSGRSNCVRFPAKYSWSWRADCTSTGFLGDAAPMARCTSLAAGVSNHSSANPVVVATSVNVPTGDFTAVYQRSEGARTLADSRMMEARAMVCERQSATREGVFAVADAIG